MTHPLVLIVDDEPGLRRFLRASLGSHGYQLLEASTGKEATRLVSECNPHLILLDLGLPDADGIALTTKFRQWTKAPIIVISARGQEDDKVAALDAGADDYLTKPFGVNELLARMRVALRHAQGPTIDNSSFDLDGLHVDFTRREVLLGGKPVHLTPIEYDLLGLFIRNAGRVLTYRQILTAIWPDVAGTQPHHVRVHVAELRKKIEAEPARPRLLVTEPGVGYRFRDKI